MRQSWFDKQLDLDPARLVFIDETWTATNMARTHGRCLKGERLRKVLPHRHRKTPTLVAELRNTGMVAPLSLTDRSMVNGSRLMLLPPFSPNFNPTEKAFSKFKALLRKAAERTVSDLWDRIGKILELIDPQEAQNYFASCGYDPP